MKRQWRRARGWVRTHPVVLTTLFFSALAGLGFRDVQAQNDRLRDLVSQLEQDRIERRREACESTLKRDEDEEVMWDDILRRAGVDGPAIGILHEGYDTLPAPSTCEPEPKR